MLTCDHNSIDICSRKVKNERLTIYVRHELESRKYIFFPSILLIRGLQLPILTQMEIGGELAKEPLNRYLYYIIIILLFAPKKKRTFSTLFLSW